MNKNQYKIHNSVLEFYHKYDIFVIDLWGVIHDGSSVYPGVVEILEFLKNEGKKIFFLSNAPRRISVVKNILNSVGVGDHLYDKIMSSGEALYLYLLENQQKNFATYTKKYYYIGPLKDIGILNGLDYEMTDDLDGAGFSIITGYINDDSTITKEREILMKMQERKMELFCANPDIKVVKQDGRQLLCAGNITKIYEEIGGNVKYFGKPHEFVYDMLLNGVEKDKILAVGDSLETDILGANSYYIDNALVCCGILKSKFGIAFGELPEISKLDEVFSEAGIYPKYVLPSFR